MCAERGANDAIIDRCVCLLMASSVRLDAAGLWSQESSTLPTDLQSQSGQLAAAQANLSKNLRESILKAQSNTNLMLTLIKPLRALDPALNCHRTHISGHFPQNQLSIESIVQTTLILQLSCECKLRFIPPSNANLQFNERDSQMQEPPIALCDWVRQREIGFLSLTPEQLLDCEALAADCISTSNVILGYALQVHAFLFSSRKTE